MKMYRIGEFWYLGFESGGKLYTVGCLGRVGDCIGPHARFKS